MHKVFFFTLMALIAVCRIAFGGEGIVSATSGELNVWRLLDYGALGIFTIYLIWDRHKRDQKEQKTADRFAAMDQKMVDALQETAVAMSTMASAANKLDASVQNLEKVLYTKPCLRPSEARTRETDRIHR